MYVNFVFQTYLPFRTDVTYKYFSRYKLFNYKYVHIVITNELHLNKDIFFYYLSFNGAAL